MKIEDFDFIIKQVGNTQVECILINRESKIRFGIVIQANAIPPNQWVFDRFIEDKRLQHFFIDIEAEIVHNEIEIEKKELFEAINEIIKADINEELKNSEKVEKIVDKPETLV